MKFEWDDSKNQRNVHRHNLDFTDAWEIFDAPMLVEADSREDYGEERFLGIGFLKNLIVVVIFTEIEPDVIRIISLRKALKYEREEFKKAIGNRLG